MDAARTETRLSYRKARTFLAQQVAGGHTHIVEANLTMALVVNIPHHSEIAHNGDAGSVLRHQDHALLTVAIRVMGIGLAHHNKYFAALAGRSRSPPFATI